MRRLRLVERGRVQVATQEGEGGANPWGGLRGQDDGTVGTEANALPLGLSERPKIDAAQIALEEPLSSGDGEKLEGLIGADGDGASVERSRCTGNHTWAAHGAGREALDFDQRNHVLRAEGWRIPIDRDRMIPSLRDEEDLLGGQDVHRLDITRSIGQRHPVPLRIHLAVTRSLRLGQSVKRDDAPALVVVSGICQIKAGAEVTTSAGDVLPIIDGLVHLEAGLDPTLPVDPVKERSPVPVVVSPDQAGAPDADGHAARFDESARESNGTSDGAALRSVGREVSAGCDRG